MDPPKTQLIYLLDTYKFVDTATVLQVDSTFVILDRTIFHPQGGGQPSDVGTIESVATKATFFVKDAHLDRGTGCVHHRGELEAGSTFTVGEEVTLKIDEEKRRLCARLHSAGHLLDLCLGVIPEYKLLPGKGYHFPGGGAYVEYTGSIPPEKRDEVKAQLQTECNRLFQESRAKPGDTVQVQEVEFDRIETLCGYLPDYLPRDQPARVVSLVKGALGCPCGGTHVKSIQEIGSMKLTKIRARKGVIRVGYDVQ